MYICKYMYLYIDNWMITNFIQNRAAKVYGT